MGITSLFNFTLGCYNLGLFGKEFLTKIQYHKYIKKQKENISLKNYKKSDKCYICGNGPSLKKVDLDALDGDTIVMNDHWRIASNFRNKPTYYIINDEAYGNPILKDRMIGVLKCFPEIPHLFSSRIGPDIEKYYSEEKAQIYYFNPVGRLYNHKYQIDFTKCTFYTWNVLTTAIQLAIYLGYKEIYLIGADYSLFASRYLTHMYDKDGAKIKSHVRLRDMLFKYSFATHVHYEIAQYAKVHNIKIINLTSETLLDAYEIDPESNY